MNHFANLVRRISLVIFEEHYFAVEPFRLAAACASAVLVCGTAIGTGIYFGNKDNPIGNADDNERRISLVIFEEHYFAVELV